MERRAVEANRRAAGATGWRRLFAGGTLWAPAALGIAQVLGIAAADERWSPVIAFRGVILLLCAVQVIVTLGDRQARRRTEVQP